MTLNGWFHVMCLQIIRSSGVATSMFKRISVDSSSIINAAVSSTSASTLMNCAGWCTSDQSCQSFVYNKATTSATTCQKLNPFFLTNSPTQSMDAYLKVEFVEQPNIGNLMVVGGSLSSNGSVSTDVEIIDPNNASSKCTKPPSYPIPTWAFAGGFVTGHFVACGGYISDDVDSCYLHNPSVNNWQLIMPLPQKTRHAKATSMGNLYLTTGGGAGSSILGNSQAFKVGEGYVSFSGLPFTLGRHCMANINSTHVLLVGGTRTYIANAAADVQNALILNVPTQQYKQLPSLDQLRLDPFCGVITRLSGASEFVIAGGSSDVQGNSPLISTMIFSPMNDTWRTGPNLPSAMSGGGSVQYGGNAFLILHPNGIYKYDVINDAWITLSGKMKTPRRWFAFALVPSDYVQCS